MKKLSEVIESLGYGTKEEQISLIKLAAFTGCFSKQTKEEEKPYIGTIISNKKAEELGNETIFASLEEGIKWWIDITQAAWFRRNQYLRTQKYMKLKELKAKTPERPPADLNRWSEIEEKEISTFIEELGVINDTAENKKSERLTYSLDRSESEIRKDLKAIFQNLYLLQSIEFKDVEKIKHLVIHGGKENVIKEGINFIDKNLFKGCVYYASNARFLFNDESSLASIIAKWFDKGKKKESKIKNAISQLLENENKKSEKSRRDWTKNLPELKNDILTELREKKLIAADDEWPMGRGYYYEDPGIYEKNIELEGLPKYSTAGWPTAMDMIYHLLQQHFSGNVNRFTLCPIYPKYRNYKHIATTEDTVEAWYKKCGMYLPKDTLVIFLSTNIRLHYILYQDIISREILRREKSNLQIETIGPGMSSFQKSTQQDQQEDRNFCFKYGIDALAKTMYFSSQNLNSGLLLFSPKNSIKSKAKMQILDTSKYESDSHAIEKEGDPFLEIS